LNQHTEQTGYAIETHNLRKVFGGHVAVGNLSLSVPRGEIFGFLGPNGAGKSTSIKMLLGLVHPSSGDAFVLGDPAGDVAARRRIGFLPEDFRFYDWLTATELVQLHGRLCGMTNEKLRERVPEVIDLVGLAQHRDRRVKGFSKGMLQRIGLAQALVHEPDLIFLDEPTSGLDPMGRLMVRDILRAERDRGATVFLNSHLLSEIEVTCDRVAFIKNGEVVVTRDLANTPAEEVRVVVDARHVSQQAVAGLTPWAEGIDVTPEQLRFRVRSKDVLPDVMRFLVASGADIFGFTPEPVSLEEIFVTIMGEDTSL
jgi:ABC-2 type transport system ATP-binding protein